MSGVAHVIPLNLTAVGRVHFAAESWPAPKLTRPPVAEFVLASVQPFQRQSQHHEFGYVKH